MNSIVAKQKNECTDQDPLEKDIVNTCNLQAVCQCRLAKNDARRQAYAPGALPLHALVASRGCHFVDIVAWAAGIGNFHR